MTVSNASDVSFTEEIIDTSVNRPWMKALGDLDGDGALDLIVAGRSGPLVLYRNPSWSKITISTTIGVDGSSTDVTAADIDGDGDTDVALANGKWFENPRPSANPLGGAWPMRSYDNANGHDVQVVDLDGDGDADIVTRHQGAAGASIRFLRQNGDKTWTLRVVADVPAGEGLNYGDLDLDGDQDVIIPQYWYENTGNITSGNWPKRPYSSSYTYAKGVVAIGDLNNDGRKDIVVAPAEAQGGRYRTSWFKTPSDPRAQTSFTETVILPDVESVVHSLQVADFNLDGRLDVVTAEMHQGRDPDDVIVHLNDGVGVSWNRTTISTAGSHNLQAGDVDGDGDTDILGANWDASAPDTRIKLWRNQAAGGSP